MKPLVLIVALSMALSVSLMAQSQEEKKTAKPKDTRQLPVAGKQDLKKDVKKDVKGFVDTDGDGIDDRKLKPASDDPGTGNNVRQHNRMRDHFIDNDGDGINDNRCNGLGFGNKSSSHHRRGGGK